MKISAATQLLTFGKRERVCDDHDAIGNLENLEFSSNIVTVRNLFT